MYSRVSGRFAISRDQHPLKTLLSILLTPSSMVIFLRFAQLKNAYPSMEAMFLGITREMSPLQYGNALNPMDEAPERSTLERFVSL